MFAAPALKKRGLSLRPAREADASFQRALFETARADAAILLAWPEAVRRPFLDQQFRFQTVHYAQVYPDADRLLVLAQGAPVGRLIVSRAPAHWCLVDLALMPAWRGRGIGTLLLKAVQAAARRAGVPSFRLMVEPRNPARRLYERLGFAEIADHQVGVEMEWRPAQADRVS